MGIHMCLIQAINNKEVFLSLSVFSVIVTGSAASILPQVGLVNMLLNIVVSHVQCIKSN